MSLQVVILEDEYMLRHVLRDVILAFDHEIYLQQFYNSDEAAVYVDQHVDDIDLFILDVRVPGKLDGIQLAQKIRERNTTSAIVVTSAYKPANIGIFEKLGIQWYPKPWHIMETTKHLLEVAKANKARQRGV
jgi:response regulator of citrate/malate metabolism